MVVLQKHHFLAGMQASPVGYDTAKLVDSKFQIYQCYTCDVFISSQENKGTISNWRAMQFTSGFSRINIACHFWLVVRAWVLSSI